ncbi:hypothetical protein Lfu02_74550 [Longispora fulva]|uniref:Uncharacterized protein n=1 Tax=Longispora fulva TaxID=619741 RepID=A0A8J7GP40_9ACTN|nr:hypothetical protein [Longispora fulva]MBG6134191.1 hypothetical protein [Longispora fulva]GIG63083.1 hypothetical protein Lfu02_74550 [Longispora fulva]
MSKSTRSIATAALLTGLAVVAVPASASAVITPPPNTCGGDLSDYAGSTYLGTLTKAGPLEMQIRFDSDGERLTNNINGPTQRSQTQSSVVVRNNNGRSEVSWFTLKGTAVGENLSCAPGSTKVQSIGGFVYTKDGQYEFLLDKVLV